MFLLALSYTGFAATYYSRVATGNFSAVGSWSVNPNGIPTNGTALANGDTFIIQTGNNITLDGNRTAAAITVQNGGTLSLTTANRSLTLNNPLIIDNGGTLSLANRTLTLAASSIENSGSITGSTGEISKTTGTFTNTATGTVTMSGGTAFAMGTGDFVNDNTSNSVNFGTGALTISGTAANQFIGGFTTTGRFTVSKTAGITTLTGDINSGGITKSGASTLNMGTGLTHTTTNTVVLTAGTMNGGTSTINVNLTSATAWQGTGSVFVPESSTVNFGGVAQTLNASSPKTFYNLTLSNSGVKTIAGTTVNNILSMEGTATASVAPTYGASATLRYNTATSRTAGVEWLSPFAGLGGVIIDNTGIITTNGNKIFSLGAPLTITLGATLTPAAGHTFSFGGDLINAGTWTSSTGDVTITDASNPQSIGSFSTDGIVSMTKTSGDATFTGNIIGGSLLINGAGRLFLGTSLDHVITGDWTFTNGILRGQTSTLHIGGNGSVTGGNFVRNNSTIDFNGSGAQNIPAFTYNLFTTSTGGIKTLLGNTTVTNILSIGASTILAAGANTLDISGDGSSLVVTGTFDEGTSTVNFSSALSTNIPAINYYNLDGTGGDRTLANSGTIGIANTFTPGAGTYTVTNSTVNFNGSIAQTIPDFTFYKLILSNTNNKTIQNASVVSVNDIEIQEPAILNILGTGVINITSP